ncbi:ABC transporter permease [Streptomyces sp. NPDC054995]
MLLPVSVTLGVVLAVLLVLTAAVAAWASLGRPREILVAGVRAAAQLAAVSLLIGWVVRSLAPLLGFVALMFAVAVWTAGRRITDNRTLGVSGGSGPGPRRLARHLAALPKRPNHSAMRTFQHPATVLSGRRALDELTVRRGEVEAGMALGLLDRDARLEIVRPAASDALLPGLDQARTVGLVTLPGAFVGMLLGGASPVEAGAVRLFVLVALMAVQVVAVAAVLELVARGWLHRR